MDDDDDDDEETHLLDADLEMTSGSGVDDEIDEAEVDDVAETIAHFEQDTAEEEEEESDENDKVVEDDDVDGDVESFDCLWRMALEFEWAKIDRSLELEMVEELGIDSLRKHLSQAVVPRWVDPWVEADDEEDDVEGVKKTRD